MQKEFINIDNGVRIAYKWVTPEVCTQDYVIVFLHEALGSIGQWKQFPQLLCTALETKGLVYERQGYGESSPLTAKRNVNYLRNYAWEEAPQVIRGLVKNEKIILLGHSDGASIALMYASKFPKQVIKVIAIAGHVLVEEKTLQGFIPILKLYREGKFNGLKKYHGTHWKDVFHAWYDTWTSETYRNWNICDIIHQNIPTLIIQGEEDEYATTKHVHLIADQLTQATIVMISECHHQPHLEKQLVVVKLIKDWLEQHGSYVKKNN